MTVHTKLLNQSTLEIIAENKLTKSDYDRFLPEVEEMVQSQGKIDLLVRLRNFAGWSPKALWEDLKFDFKHYRDVSKVALVGENKSQEWMSTLSKPFTAAKVKFFTRDQLSDAREWLVAE